MNSKKTLLSLINGGAVLGAPSAQSTVKFQYSTSHATAVSNKTDGALTFVSDSNGYGAIYVNDSTNGGTLVSSKIQNIATAAATDNKHGGKTVTITYINAANGNIATDHFDVIDEAALEAYFAGSKTIALNAETNLYEVKIKENGGLAVDDTNGLFVDIDDVFGVDASTIGFIEGTTKLHSLLKLQYHAAVTEGTPKAAYIALEDKDGNSINEIPVQEIIGNGILKSVTYNKDTNQLILVFAQADGSEKTVTVDMKDLIDINDIFLDTEHDADNYLTLTNDTSIATFGVTNKTKTGIALAETAVQGISESGSVENYVKLGISAKSNSSTYDVSIDDSALKSKIDAIDQKDSEQDSSIDRLDASVSSIETAIAAMDADISTAVSLDVANGIYVRGTLTEADGVVTAIGLTTAIDTTSQIDYVKADPTQSIEGVDPAFSVTGAGLAVGADLTKLAKYVDDKVQKLADEQGDVLDGLDSQVIESDGSNFITVTTGIVNGKLLDASSSVSVTYGNYDKTSQTDGIAKTSTTKAYVDQEIQALDLAASAANASANDTAGFVKTTISETDGIVKNESVEVTYGNYDTHNNGIAKTADTSIFVEQQITNALTWQILP